MQQRQENLELALKQFAANIGSCPIREFIINLNDGQYQGILETTWLDLQRSGYLPESGVKTAILPESGAFWRPRLSPNPVLTGVGPCCRASTNC
jgi:hypothetical protein